MNRRARENATNETDAQCETEKRQESAKRRTMTPARVASAYQHRAYRASRGWSPTSPLYFQTSLGFFAAMLYYSSAPLLVGGHTGFANHSGDTRFPERRPLWHRYGRFRPSPTMGPFIRKQSRWAPRSFNFCSQKRHLVFIDYQTQRIAFFRFLSAKFPGIFLTPLSDIKGWPGRK